MKLVSADERSVFRPATVNKIFSLGGEHVRYAMWEEGETTVTVQVIGYVSGIRAHRNPDGSVDLLGQVTRFDVMRENEFVQPVERAVFLWSRHRRDENGGWVREEDIDYCNEIGVVYQDTTEAALDNVKVWLDDLDFEVQFDPTAWEVPVNG